MIAVSLVVRGVHGHAELGEAIEVLRAIIEEKISLNQVFVMGKDDPR